MANYKNMALCLSNLSKNHGTVCCSSLYDQIQATFQCNGKWDIYGLVCKIKASLRKSNYNMMLGEKLVSHKKVVVSFNHQSSTNDLLKCVTDCEPIKLQVCFGSAILTMQKGKKYFETDFKTFDKYPKKLLVCIRDFFTPTQFNRPLNPPKSCGSHYNLTFRDIHRRQLLQNADCLNDVCSTISECLTPAERLYPSYYLKLYSSIILIRSSLITSRFYGTIKNPLNSKHDTGKSNRCQSDRQDNSATLAKNGFVSSTENVHNNIFSSLDTIGKNIKMLEENKESTSNQSTNDQLTGVNQKGNLHNDIPSLLLKLVIYARQVLIELRGLPLLGRTVRIKQPKLINPSDCTLPKLTIDDDISHLPNAKHRNIVEIIEAESSSHSGTDSVVDKFITSNISNEAVDSFRKASKQLADKVDYKTQESSSKKVNTLSSKIIGTEKKSPAFKLNSSKEITKKRESNKQVATPKPVEDRPSENKSVENNYLCDPNNRSGRYAQFIKSTTNKPISNVTIDYSLTLKYSPDSSQDSKQQNRQLNKQQKSEVVGDLTPKQFQNSNYDTPFTSTGDKTQSKKDPTFVNYFKCRFEKKA